MGGRADRGCDYETREGERSEGEKGEWERVRRGEEMGMTTTTTTTTIKKKKKKKNRCDAYLSCDGMMTETLPCSIGRNA